MWCSVCVAQVHINIATSRAFVRRMAAANESEPCTSTKHKLWWRLCTAAWREAQVVEGYLRFVVFEARAYSVDCILHCSCRRQSTTMDTSLINRTTRARCESQCSASLKVLGVPTVTLFLMLRTTGQPATTAPGGHAMLSPAAYLWRNSTTGYTFSYQFSLLMCMMLASCAMRGMTSRAEARILLDPPHALRVECTLPHHDVAFKDRVVLELRDPALPLSIDLELCKADDRGYTLSVCTMPLFPPLPPSLLSEWIAYHLMLGVDHFYIMDRFGTFEEACNRVWLVTSHTCCRC